jgi:hypothetical protein
MEHPHEPVDAIKSWQEWYKTHRMVAQLDQPLVSKDSREKLHDTTHAVDKLPNWREHYAQLITDPFEPMDNTVHKQKAFEYFADTLAEFANELTGRELFDCFVKAATEAMEHEKKEYEQAKELLDLLSSSPTTQSK